MVPCDQYCHECKFMTTISMEDGQGLFAQTIAGMSYLSLLLDLWIEMTTNKGSRMKAGGRKVLRNEMNAQCELCEWG